MRAVTEVRFWSARLLSFDVRTGRRSSREQDSSAATEMPRRHCSIKTSLRGRHRGGDRMNPRTQHAGTPAADRLARPPDGEADSGSFRSGRNGDLYVSRREYRHNLILPRRDRSTPGIPLVPALREDFYFAWREDQGRKRLSESPAQRPLPDKLSILRHD